MELTRAAIKENKDHIPGLDGYYLIVSKIEKNIDVNPDIAIEACKSLIEGLCKMALNLISSDYANSAKIKSKCNSDLPYLVGKAFDDVFSNKVESQLNNELYNLIDNQVKWTLLLNKAKAKYRDNSRTIVAKIAAIRHERGDISHGKIYPKEIESGVNLARSIASITDGLCSYMIYEFSSQYLANEMGIKKLVYDDLSEFNSWLDNQVDHLTTKIDFSQSLFKHIYEKYEEIYYSDYLEYLESIQDELEQIKEDKSTKDTPIEISEAKKPTSVITQEIIELINTFDESAFWTEQRTAQVASFAEVENINPDGLKAIISNYLFTQKRPFRDEAVAIMNEKPTLKDRAKITEELTDKIIVFAKDLTQTE